MRVIVCGSRNWEGIWATERIHRVLLAVELLAGTLNSPLQIVHGNCPSGADAIADRWARRRGYEPVVFDADWSQYGKAAGPMRNTTMGLAGGDMCIGFLRDASRGTLDMLGKAEKYGIPAFVVDWEEEGFYEPDEPVDGVIAAFRAYEQGLTSES